MAFKTHTEKISMKEIRKAGYGTLIIYYTLPEIIDTILEIKAVGVLGAKFVCLLTDWNHAGFMGT